MPTPDDEAQVLDPVDGRPGNRRPMRNLYTVRLSRDGVKHLLAHRERLP